MARKSSVYQKVKQSLLLRIGYHLCFLLKSSFNKLWKITGIGTHEDTGLIMMCTLNFSSDNMREIYNGNEKNYIWCIKKF